MGGNLQDHLVHWREMGRGMWGVRLHSGTHGKSEDNLRWCPSSYTMLGLGPLVGPQQLHKLGQLASSLEKFCFLFPISLEVCEEHRCTLPRLALHKSCAFKLGFSECTPSSSSMEPSPNPLRLILWRDQAWMTLTMWQHCDASQSSVTSLEHSSSNRMSNIRPKVSTECRIKTGSV